MGLLTGFAGTVLILAPRQQHRPAGWGVAALLAAAASYAAAFAYLGRHLAGHAAPLALSAAQLLAATALAATALPATPPGTPTPGGIAAVTVLGILATGVTFHLNHRLIADAGPTTTAAIGYLLPVVAVGLGALALDEPLTARTIAGAAVVLAGVVLTRRSAPRPLSGPGAAATTAPPTRAPRTPAPNTPPL